MNLIAVLSVMLANAATRDRTTILVVREPIIAGDKVLEKGTYIWRLLDPASDRHVVQITNRETGLLETT